MASTLEAIPERFQRADVKAEFIAWLRATNLPSRFKRKLLHDWGAAMHVAVSADDYHLVELKGER